MSLSEQITAVLVFLTAGILAVISIRSFRNRGYLLNNAYIFASDEERRKLDKKPHYRQTAIVFLLLSVVFIILGISIILRDSRINLLEIPVIIGAMIYAIVSSIQIGKKTDQKQKGEGPER